MNIQMRCHCCIYRILFLAYEEIRSRTVPPCEGAAAVILFILLTTKSHSYLLLASSARCVPLHKHNPGALTGRVESCGGIRTTRSVVLLLRDGSCAPEDKQAALSTNGCRSRWHSVLAWISTAGMHWETQHTSFCIMGFCFRILWIQNNFETTKIIPKPKDAVLSTARDLHYRRLLCLLCWTTRY